MGVQSKLKNQMTLQESIEYLSEQALQVDEGQAELYGQVIQHLQSLDKYKKAWAQIRSKLNGTPDLSNLGIPDWLLEELGGDPQ